MTPAASEQEPLVAAQEERPQHDEGMDLKRLLKIFRHVNDENRARVNLKFIALVAAFLITGTLLVTFTLLNPPAAPGADPTVASEEQTAFVGLTTVEAALYGEDTEIIDQRLATWVNAHPEAEILSLERQHLPDGTWIGYEITYVVVEE